MTEHVKCFWQNIGQNIRTLFLFELLYRMLGVLIIFPLARLLFYVSIEWYGQPYITQSMMPSYLFRPSTVLLFIILMIVLAVYLMGEMMVLATLFNYSHHKRTVRLKPLLFHVFNTLQNRQFMTYLKWLFPAIILFFAVEFLHLVGIVSTVTLPLEVSEALHTQWLLRIGFYSFLVVMIYLTAETFFTLHGTLIQKQPWRVVRQETKSLLRKKRLKVIIGLILINFVLNVLIYALYVVFVGLLALLIFITRGQAYVLGVLLTALYTFYLIATGLASLILVPVNYAWLSTQYYQLKKTTPLLIEVPLYHESKTRSFDKIWLKRASTVTVLTIFLLNVTSVFTALTEPESRVSYLKRPEIIAHRGAALIAPENTLSALEAALEMDVDVIEFDVRETHDGVPILMHDTRLGRTTDDAANRFVHDVSFDDMRRLDAGSWFSEDFAEERVPSLAEA